MNTPLSTAERMRGVRWQGWLRRSARLYLALHEPGTDKRQVEARLRVVERQMMRYLVPDKHLATVAATQQVWTLVQAAQQALLRDKTQVALLLTELSVEQAISSVPMPSSEE